MTHPNLTEMSPCTKKGCTARRFMDSERCFDHQGHPGGALFVAWFVFCALLSIAGMAFAAWVIYTLVTWVVSQ